MGTTRTRTLCVRSMEGVMRKLAGKVAVVTGASKGIGAEIAGIRSATAMEIKSVLRAAGAAFAIALAAPAAARERAETVALNFERVIPNIPSKSLVAVVVDYAPGGASLPHTHAKSAFIFAYVVSGAIESQVNDEPKRV